MTDALTHLTHFPSRLWGEEQKRTGIGAHTGGQKRQRKNASDASVRQVAAGLADLARAVVRLCPDRRDPERFHADKSDIAHALRALARRLGDAA